MLCYADDNLSIMADIGVVELLLKAMENHIKVSLFSFSLSSPPLLFNQCMWDVTVSSLHVIKPLGGA